MREWLYRWIQFTRSGDGLLGTVGCNHWTVFRNERFRQFVQCRNNSSHILEHVFVLQYVDVEYLHVLIAVFHVLMVAAAGTEFNLLCRCTRIFVRKRHVLVFLIELTLLLALCCTILETCWWTNSVGGDRLERKSGITSQKIRDRSSSPESERWNL